MKLNLNSENSLGNQNHFKTLVEALVTVGTKVYFEKDEEVFTEGGKVDFMLIVEEGILRTWRLVNDKEVVLGFTFPGDLETSPISFLTSTPSQDTIDAICNTTCIKVSRQVFFDKLNELDIPEGIIQSILLEYIDVMINRHLASKAYTAEENYINLLLKQPKLVNEIPLKDVASFLGISKERLSRIRKKHDLT